MPRTEGAAVTPRKDEAYRFHRKTRRSCRKGIPTKHVAQALVFLNEGRKDVKRSALVACSHAEFAVARGFVDVRVIAINNKRNCMSELLKSIDARAKLAGTNKLEILMFSLGTDTRTGRCETFGINVFKVREVMRIPEITRAPEMPAAVEGMVSLRGALVPVIDLAKYIGLSTEGQPEIMIVTEYNGHTQGFLVKAVDNILRLDWSSMRVPPAMLVAEMGGLVTAITELKDKRLVMMIDVEKVLSETGHFSTDEMIFNSVRPLGKDGRTVFFADDSSVARNQIAKTLEAMGVQYKSAINGRQAWSELSQMADYAVNTGIPLKNIIQLILTDVEMPEMDGYMLTRKIKEDKRFAGIPVLMHSSLSGGSNQQLGKSVGVDEYIPKFEPQKLSQALARLLA